MTPSQSYAKPSPFPAISRKTPENSNMEKGLRIHIGSIPSTLFPGTITSLELFLVDSHNNVAAKYCLLYRTHG